MLDSSKKGKVRIILSIVMIVIAEIIEKLI